MVATNSIIKPLRFAISYGLAGGKLHSSGLRNLMRQIGFETASVEEADIIIAHSAGCWLIPSNSRPKLVMYVGMPLANTQPFKTWRKAVKTGYSQQPVKRNLKITSKNIYHWLAQPIHNVRIIKDASASKPSIFQGVPSVFVANQHDPWPTGAKLDEFVDSHSDNCVFINLPSSHDDIWDNPEHYVDIIRYYAGLLD